MPPKKNQEKANLSIQPVDISKFVTGEGNALEVAVYLTEKILESVDYAIWMKAVE